MVTPAVRREAVAHLMQDHEESQRRARDVVGATRSVVRYVQRRVDDAILACCRFHGHRVKVTLIVITPCPREYLVILLGAVHCTSRNMLSLTAHAAHTAVSNILI